MSPIRGGRRRRRAHTPRARSSDWGPRRSRLSLSRRGSQQQCRFPNMACRVRSNRPASESRRAPDPGPRSRAARCWSGIRSPRQCSSSRRPSSSCVSVPKSDDRARRSDIRRTPESTTASCSTTGLLVYRLRAACRPLRSVTPARPTAFRDAAKTRHRRPHCRCRPWSRRWSPYHAPDVRYRRGGRMLPRSRPVRSRSRSTPLGTTPSGWSGLGYPADRTETTPPPRTEIPDHTSDSRAA